MGLLSTAGGDLLSKVICCLQVDRDITGVEAIKILEGELISGIA